MSFSSFNLNITIILIALTCLISIPAFNNPKMKNEMFFWPWRMQNGRELYRFITHGLIHADFLHLFFNMLTLFFFGPTVEAIIGKTAFIVLYVTALIVSSLYDFFKQKHNPNYVALGASGAVSAILFVVIIVDPWISMIRIFFALPIPNLVFAIGYVAYSQYMGKKGIDNVGHFAHLWGALYGFAFAAAVRPDLLQNFISRLLHP